MVLEEGNVRSGTWHTHPMEDYTTAGTMEYYNKPYLYSVIPVAWYIARSPSRSDLARKIPRDMYLTMLQ